MANIPLPSQLSYGRIKGKVAVAVADTTADADTLPDGLPANGVILFTPDVPYIAVSSAKTVVQLKPIPVTVNAVDGSFSVDLVGTTDADINPRLWTYSVDMTGVFGPGIPIIHIEVPEGSEQDLADLLPVALSSGVATLRGPKGDPGSGAKSAYDVAVDNGYVGTPAAWLASLVGAQGGVGPAGPDGKTIRTGTTAATSVIGVDGDYYINRTAWTISGPKAGGTWPTAVSIVGPAGGTGPTGPAGPSGKTVLSGTGAPASATGTTGDFYVDTSTSRFYGPKGASAWPTTFVQLAANLLVLNAADPIPAGTSAGTVIVRKA